MKFELLSEAPEADKPRELATKYGVTTWQDYKAGKRVEDPTTLQRIATIYVHMLSMTGDTPRYVILGEPMIKLYVTAGEIIPATFEEAKITYNLNQPFYCTVLL